MPMMLRLFRSPVPWRRIAGRTLHEINDDRCFGLAAQLAFYFLLALFPTLLFLVALIAYLPVEDALSRLLATLGTVAPLELVVLLQRQLERLASGDSAGLITLGVAGAIWSSSAAMVAIIDALNQAYDIAEWRPWWKRRLVAIALTIALTIFTSIAFSMVLAGPDVAAWLPRTGAAGTLAALISQVLRWPVMIACAVIALDLLYHFAPNRRERWAWITPGALLAMTLWIASSFGFKLYLTNVADYTATYGAIGGAVVTMIWFYLSGLAVLVGAELNAVIEQSWRAD
jgi:membrane protein